FDRLTGLTNKCFGRQLKPKNRAEDICFGLGHTCWEDFHEVLFMAINGYGNGASKLLRALYERALAVAYLVKHPDKAERLVRFAGLQDHKLLLAALQAGITEADIDAALKSSGGVAAIRERYEMVKPELPKSVSWDKNVASMVHDVGEPYRTLYLICYAVPNLAIHAILVSATRYEKEDKADEQRMADFAVFNAVILCMNVMESQNRLFNLRLDEQIEECHKGIEDVWPTQKTALERLSRCYPMIHSGRVLGF